LNTSTARKVLVVDDEALIAALLEDMLVELSCDTIGPALTLDQGLALARESEMDAAILDLSLNGQPVFPIAEVLAERKIPFVFASGYAEIDRGGRFGDIEVVQKPFRLADLAAALDRLTKAA
jgi:two-component SAPR family response regulator